MGRLRRCSEGPHAPPVTLQHQTRKCTLSAGPWDASSFQRLDSDWAVTDPLASFVPEDHSTAEGSPWAPSPDDSSLPCVPSCLPYESIEDFLRSCLCSVSCASITEGIYFREGEDGQGDTSLLSTFQDDWMGAIMADAVLGASPGDEEDLKQSMASFQLINFAAEGPQSEQVRLRLAPLSQGLSSLLHVSFLL